MNTHSPRRRPTNLALDAELVADAKAEGINLSRACEAGLSTALAKARADRWLAENVAAIEAWNEWTAKRGLPLATLRQF